MHGSKPRCGFPGGRRYSGIGGWRRGFDAQGVDVGVHQVANRFVDEFVTLQWPQVGEPLRGYFHGEMPPAITRTCMAHVLVAFIHDLERRW